jgi:hypothetical protein
MRMNRAGIVIEAKGGPRKPHYVPQFYLRGFSDDKKQLLVTDRPTEKVFRTNPTNVAAQRDFNTIEGEDPHAVEKAHLQADRLGDLDHAARQVFDRTVAKEAEPVMAGAIRRRLSRSG